MTELIDMSATVALDRLAAWKIALRAENKSPGTVTIYADCVSRYLRWCAEHDNRPMSRACLNQWVAGCSTPEPRLAPPASGNRRAAASRPGSPPAASSPWIRSPA